jgi:hypothetical protein
MMRLALLLPFAYASDDHYATEDDHIKPAEFMSRWGTDTLPDDASISTPALAEAWMKRGLKARDAGALEAAVRAQWRGAFHAPFFAHSWRHLGNALLRSAAYDLSCEYAVEARHALSLAYFHLRDAHAGKGLQALDAIGELGDCYVEMELDKAENTALRALAALDGDRSQASSAADAVATYCDDLQGVRVEGAGAFAPRVARRFYAALRICGVVSLGELMDEETLRAVATLETEVRSAFEAGQGGKGLASAALSDPRVRGRGRNRFEVELPALELNASVVANAVLHPLVGLVLGTAGVELDAISSVVAYPGAALQDHHADTSEIVDVLRRQGELPHLPAHGVIAIVPLVPLDPTKNGGTQFELGSHISRLRDTELRTRPAIANSGDTYVYDLRARHGGLPNAGSAPRSLLSLPYVKDWYVDAVNHPTRHTESYEAVNDTTLKKLLVRVDARRHHEDLFAARGVCDNV